MMKTTDRREKMYISMPWYISKPNMMAMSAIKLYAIHFQQKDYWEL